jgi:hypothetical protein
MPGRDKAPSQGRELQTKVIELAGRLGLEARMEVRAARRLWGAERRIDVVLKDPSARKLLGVECKFQSVAGSAEEKIPAMLKDIEFWPIPGIVTIEGPGFSKGMENYLLASGKVVRFEDLEDWLRLYFAL